MEKQKLAEEILVRRMGDETAKDIFTFCESYDAISAKYLDSVERDCINYLYGFTNKKAGEQLYKDLGPSIPTIAKVGINKLSDIFWDKKGFVSTLNDDGDVVLLTYIKPDGYSKTIRLKDRVADEWLEKDIDSVFLSQGTIKVLKKWKFHKFCGIDSIKTVKDLVVLLNTRLVRLKDIPRINESQVNEILENPIISNFLYEKSFKHHVELHTLEQVDMF